LLLADRDAKLRDVAADLVGEGPAGNPRVTVVIPTRDRAEFLRRSVLSALHQNGVSHEVVVIDDGSRDDTVSMLEALADPRVRTISLGVSHGVSAARNCGIEAARGAWIAFLDDDDVWSPDKLKLQLAAAEQTREAVIGYTGCVYIDTEGAIIRKRRTPALSEFPRGLADTNLIGGPSTVMVRTDAVRAAGGFDPLLSTLADWDLWLRLCPLGAIFAVPEVLVGYRIHAANMHSGATAGIRRELRYLRRKHADFAAAQGTTIATAEFSLWLVKRYRESGRRLDAAREYMRLAWLQRRPRQLARAAAMLAQPQIRNGFEERDPLERETHVENPGRLTWLATDDLSPIPG
jgi:glycosyltransferase involved in cell wall biosynthesis